MRLVKEFYMSMLKKSINIGVK